MEAEISASTLGLEDDDNTVQPQEPATSSSKISYQDHLGSETLPEDLFTSDVNQPPSPAAAATVQVSIYKNAFFRLFPIISISQKFFSIFFLTLEKIGIDEKVICYHNISNYVTVGKIVLVRGK